MKIAFASAEVFPFAKTGGLGDVLGALPKALAALGCDIKVFLPKYSIVDHSKFDLSYNYSIGEITIRVAGNCHPVNVYHSTLPNSKVEVYFIDCPYYFNRPKIYTSDPDEDERFILFSKAVIESLQHLRWKPDVIHCNDWQTGLIPLYLKDNYRWDELFFRNTATVMTIHNIAYQGRFPKSTMYKAEINPELFYLDSPIEFWGDISFLKTGLMYSDVINTVSNTYAEEITMDDKGGGLSGVLRYRINDFYGILNGVDYAVWNPALDKMLPHLYSPEDLSGKLENKRFLHHQYNLSFANDKPLIGMVSRLVPLKGFDLFASCVKELMSLNANWVFLGTGDSRYEDLLRSLTYVYPGKVFAYTGFNDELSHLIEAASDIFLMPSQFEPCGLNQIYSLKYATLPIVHKTGGLADTVIDWDEASHQGKLTGNGFSFVHYNAEALLKTVRRAIDKYHQKDIWNQMMQNAMSCNFSWEESAKKYIDLYKKAIINRKNGN
ncbi:MAG: glycogen synthase GlgA [Ignavibacteria bacterium]|nr:glycogen synthase GlgA [Ignavibacteria bacterium]